MTPASSLNPPRHGVHIWYCALEPGLAPQDSVPNEEIARAAAMLPESKAQEFLLSRAWLRVLVAAYTDTPDPRSIRIGIREGGKPYAMDFHNVEFSLSHSCDLAAIAFCRLPVGVDIEKKRPVADWRLLADELFTRDILATIEGFPREERDAAFLRFFSAREAYLKATGGGFAGVHFADALRATGLKFAEGTAIELPEPWRKIKGIAIETLRHGIPSLLPPIAGYVGCVCIRAEP